MCSFRSCQTRFEFLSQFRKVRNAFECFITQVQTRLPKTKCVWSMKINVICTVDRRQMKIQMTKYQEVLHDIEDGNSAYEEEYKRRTHIFYDFHCKVCFIHNNNEYIYIYIYIYIQTWWRFGHAYVHAQWWYCSDRRYTPLSYGAACYLVWIPVHM